MFDIGALELFVIVVVAVIVIGPKDMPLAMRTAGRWIGKVRRVSAHFRSGLDTMVREAELEDMEKEWKARNEEIMRKNPGVADQVQGESGDAPTMTGPPPVGDADEVAAAGASAETAVPSAPASSSVDPKPDTGEKA
ncbi:MAG: Sec-independent protein translocase protein TatB [Erythrobacter sp.]